LEGCPIRWAGFVFDYVVQSYGKNFTDLYE